jgi:hypothetical protein
VGPTYLESPLDVPKRAFAAGVLLVTMALAVFLWRKLRERRYAALFPVLWYLVVVGPVLPLSGHLTEYYPFLPAIGLCWLGGWAFAEAWRSRMAWRAVATALAALYGVMVVPQTLAASEWNYNLTERARHLVESLAGAHQRHPGKAIMLYGVDGSLFWNAIRDRSFRLVGLDHLYLPPGSERLADTDAQWSGVDTFALSGSATERALERDELEVYDVRGPLLRNITATFAAMPFDRSLARRVDPGDPLAAGLLGPEWYPIDADHRWMPRRATFKMAGPEHAGQHLYLRGYCTREQLAGGPVTVTVSVDGAALPVGRVTDNAWELTLPLPDRVVGKPEMQVAVEVDRIAKPAADPRELGVAFGEIAVK